MKSESKSNRKRPISKITFSIQNKENQGKKLLADFSRVKKLESKKFLFFRQKNSRSTQNEILLGEQFTQFTKLSEFLLRQNGLQLEIDEFDDPGDTFFYS